MKTKTKVASVVVIALVSAAVGRYTVPEKVRIETKVVEIIKEVKVKDETKTKKRNKKTVIVKDTRPDGSSTETSTTTDVTDTTKHGTTSDTKDISNNTQESRETVKGSGKVNISALAGVNPLNPGAGMIYGGHVSTPVLGPITLGGFGLSTGVGGLSLGVSF